MAYLSMKHVWAVPIAIFLFAPCFTSQADPITNIGFCSALLDPSVSTQDTCSHFPGLARTSADIVIFTVGLDHGNASQGGESVGAVKDLAKTIQRTWTGDPKKVVVAISETGGCPNCGAQLTTSADILATELANVYKSPFSVKADSALDPFKASKPALVAGADWQIQPKPGVAYNPLPAGTIIAPLPGGYANYADAVLQPKWRASGSFEIMIVHPPSDTSYSTPGDHSVPRRAQLEQETDIAISRTQQNMTAVLAGDFNAVISNPQSPDDSHWVTKMRRSAYWMTSENNCVFDKSTGGQGTATPFDDYMNMVEFTAPNLIRLRPIAYLYDPAPDGSMKAPQAPISSPGVSHNVVATAFILESPPAKRLCKDAQCGVVDCCPGGVDCQGACVTLGTKENCLSCGDSCEAGYVCAAAGCKAKPDRQTCPNGERHCCGGCTPINECSHCEKSFQQRSHSAVN